MAENQNPNPEAAKNTDKPSTKKAEVLVVRGPEKGRWRAGRHFGPAAVEIPVADLKKAEIEAIESDPTLSVSRS